MLLELFPTTHLQYTSLPILGPVLEGYVRWLLAEGYARERVRAHCQTARRLARVLAQRGVGNLTEVTRLQLRGCAPRRAREDTSLAALVHSLDRYFESELLLFRPRPLGPVEQRIEVYATYLAQVRGFAPVTITRHRRSAAAFLAHLGSETSPRRIATLTAQDVEAFVRVIGQRLGRRSLHNAVAEVRNFLRFLAAAGEAPAGLHERIDTPRVYRQERLPRALPWDTVRAFLGLIDRTSLVGVRDYAIFLLIATYGLRASEVVGLTLDDLEWRARRFRVRQRKTGGVLWLPLTDEAGTAVLAYLQRGRLTPTKPFRQVFLRCRKPVRPLTRTTLNQAASAWAIRGGLPMPVHGVHCLRHSYAVHLLRLGTPLKTIGDLLGHRTMESTWGYLRLAIEDLREVALDLPAGAAHDTGPEVRS
jgi:integrase/recombinase XerD